MPDATPVVAPVPTLPVVARTIEALGVRSEALYARMQDTAVRAATAEAVNASPEEMGRDAMAAARQRASSCGSATA